jgi:hypothetical protein
MKYRKPSVIEELEAIKNKLWTLNLHREVTNDAAAAAKILEEIDVYVRAHATSGVPTEVRQERVRTAFWEQIHAKPELGMMGKPGRKKRESLEAEAAEAEES